MKYQLNILFDKFCQSKDNRSAKILHQNNSGSRGTAIAVTLKFLSILCLLCNTACKKQTLDNGDQIISPQTGTRKQFTLDSIYLYALQTYLWNDVLPSYGAFNPRKYDGTSSSEMDDYRKVIFDFSQLKINPENNLPYEHPVYPGYPKYSSIAEGKASGVKIASFDGLDGNYTGYGLAFASLDEEFYISYVLNNSPAQQAGLSRGLKVSSINGQPVTASLIKLIGLQDAFSVVAEKEDGTPVTASLVKSAYYGHPVLKATVLDYGENKFGYIAYQQFSALSNSKSALDEAFSLFNEENIRYLVVDLRYNGGGYVETAQYLANLIAPASLNGKLMYSEHFNTLMQQGKAGILKKQLYFDENNQTVYINGRRATMADVDFSVAGNTTLFNKKGASQNIKTVYFIVSENTASASELLINALKPYMDVVLVGGKTYGKPVGFFGITVDNYTLYMSSFYIKNASGNSDYFSGFTPEITSYDDVSHDFADSREACLNKIIAHVTGTASVTAVQQHLFTQTYLPDGGQVKGMVKHKMKLIE